MDELQRLQKCTKWTRDYTMRILQSYAVRGDVIRAIRAGLKRAAVDAYYDAALVADVLRLVMVDTKSLQDPSIRKAT